MRAPRLFNAIARPLSQKHIFIVQSLIYRTKKLALPLNADYVRYATLCLCQEEIIKNKVAGNIAELGVFEGDFAKRLNVLFPDRSLYLFDTFEGFDDRDVKSEQSRNFSKGDQDFSNTSVDLVLKKMKYPEKCIVKKGFFPETAEGIDDTFCFVSLDTDLYEPIMNGLRFFYPRLEKGGFIFVHDFNHDVYSGVREAVLDFCKTENIPYFPIPDAGGSVIISK